MKIIWILYNGTLTSVLSLHEGEEDRPRPYRFYHVLDSLGRMRVP
jgi:hypothetical protein